jgi:hypothetical protein
VRRLTVLERSEHIAEWVRLTEENNKGANCADIPQDIAASPKAASTPPSANSVSSIPDHQRIIIISNT